MKRELIKHLSPLLALFLFASLVWLFAQVPIFSFIYLLFGFIWGSFFIDIDHLIYWYFLAPDLPESQKAKKLVKDKDIVGFFAHLERTHSHHTSLIFHHFFFQIVLAIITLFIFTSSDSVFAKAFILAINVHLLTDEIDDFFKNPTRLQAWLFAREQKQLPRKYLPHYLLVFISLNLIAFFFLLNSQV